MSDYKGIEFLRSKLALKRVRVHTRYKYYEMKDLQLNPGITVPAQLRAQFRSTFGWCAKAVDSLADRLPALLAPLPASAPLGAAPYPAFSTACMIVSGEAVPSTASVLVKRLTLQLVTPSTLETAFSTRAWQAAQLIPVTVY